MTAVQAAHGYNCQGYRIQVRLVTPNEFPGANRNSNWDGRNFGGNSFQGNNQLFGNNTGMGPSVSGGRFGGDPFNASNVQFSTNARNIFQASAAPAGYTGDPYSYGLSSSGVQWFERFIKEGYSRNQARERALERRSQPFPSGFNSNMENNYSRGDGFDMSMLNRNMPFANDNRNNFNGGGFNNNFANGNYSNWSQAGAMLQNQPSFNAGVGGFMNNATNKRPALLDQSGLDKRFCVQAGPANRGKDTGILASMLVKVIIKTKFILK